MTITTKYNIGDTVWLIHDNKALDAKVVAVLIDAVEGGVHETYRVSLAIKRTAHELHVDYLYPSKQELLASL